MTPTIDALTVWIERSRPRLVAWGIEARAGRLEDSSALDALRLVKGDIVATYAIRLGPDVTTELLVVDAAAGIVVHRSTGDPRRSSDITDALELLVSDLRDGRFEGRRPALPGPRARIRAILRSPAGPRGFRLQDIIAGGLTCPVFLIMAPSNALLALVCWGGATLVATIAIHLAV